MKNFCIKLNLFCLFLSNEERYIVGSFYLSLAKEKTSFTFGGCPWAFGLAKNIDSPFPSFIVSFTPRSWLLAIDGLPLPLGLLDKGIVGASSLSPDEASVFSSETPPCSSLLPGFNSYSAAKLDNCKSGMKHGTFGQKNSPLSNRMKI